MPQMVLGGPSQCHAYSPTGGINGKRGPYIALQTVLEGTIYATIDGPGRTSVVSQMVRGHQL